jgi:hypothetical protein
MDSLAYSETLRQAATACIDSFWDFVRKMSAVPSIRATLNATGKELIAAAVALGQRFKGKDIQRSIAAAMSALAPFVASDDCNLSYKQLESISCIFADQTKLYKVAQLTSKTYVNFPPEAATGAFADLLSAIRF